MTINEAKDSVIEGELDHYAALPAITKHVLHDVVLADVSNEPAIVLLHKDDKEDLALADEINFDISGSQIAMNQIDFFLFFATGLLPTKSNDIIALVVGKQGLEVEVLRLTSMVPSHGQDFQGDVTQDQVSHDT